MFEPRSRRGSGSLVWKDCVFRKSWQCSPHGKQWRRLFAKPKEAAALQILLHQGPASPLLPMGRFRPVSEPCLKPSGGWAFSFVRGFSFPRLKLTATTLWALVLRACWVCSSRSPILHCSYIVGKREQAIWEAAEVGILAPSLTSSKKGGASSSPLCAPVLSL